MLSSLCIFFFSCELHRARAHWEQREAGPVQRATTLQLPDNCIIPLQPWLLPAGHQLHLLSGGRYLGSLPAQVPLWVVVRSADVSFMKSNHLHQDFHYLALSCFVTVVLCDRPSVPPYAQISGDRRTVGSVIRYSCISQRAIIGNTTRMCQLDGQWSSSPPHCSGTENPDRLCVGWEG